MDEDFEVVELSLAFSYHVVNRIMEADGIVMPSEARFIKAFFPEELLKNSGFVRADGSYTERYQTALGEALLRLPDELSDDQKKELVSTLKQAALADSHLENKEQLAVEHACSLLGIRVD